jgi:hypothetical protein
MESKIEECMIGDVIDTSGFHKRLLTHYEDTREGTLHHYLGCRITHDLEQGVTILDQAHCDYTERILKMFNAWNMASKKMHMLPELASPLMTVIVDTSNRCFPSNTSALPLAWVG